MIVRYHRQALVDLEEISTYLSERSPLGAIKVLAAINAAIKEIGQNPFGARQTSDPAVRVKIARRYLYKIFYSATAREVVILHVRHGARRPWIAE